MSDISPLPSENEIVAADATPSPIEVIDSDDALRVLQEQRKTL